ncbi:ABC transporter permease [Planctomycetes bacterium TBK1r]|uniref:Transport permease protein n=1 Tax=Stieleria magnilauensis TaxID=2527963 RepID=A0ABX5XLQ6_9BACT|nr:Polysialic acid transport protein KpsM [Planctomycetes bacterium TBK1r]
MSTSVQSTTQTTSSAANQLPEVVYSPESPLAKPGKLVGDVFGDLWRYRELIWILFLRDLKAQFRQSYLGYVWLFLPPVMTTAIWLFLNAQQVIAVEETQIPYPVFVIIGTVVWQTFVKLLQSPVVSFAQGKPVFMKLNVPAEAFIAAGTARAVFEFLIYSIVLVPVFLTYQIMPPWTIVFIPLIVVTLMVTGTALGLMLVPIGSLYTDVQQAIPVIMGFLMYLSPVVFPPPRSGIASVVIAWNPMTPILMGTRDILTSGDTQHLMPMAAILVAASIICVLSTVAIRIVMPHLVARMGM